MKQFLTAFLGLSIILGFLFAAIFLPINQSGKTIDQLLPNHVDFGALAEIRKTNLWEDLFRDPVEHLYVFYPDGMLYHITSYEASRVNMDANVLIETLKRDNHPISDALIVIHNHWGYPAFSVNDRNFYHILSMAGFQGRFLLFVQPIGEVRELKK
jgi:hypothetical protein